MLELLFGVTTLLVLLTGMLVVLRLQGLDDAAQRQTLELLAQELEDKHRAMLSDLHSGLANQTEKEPYAALAQQGELLHDAVSRSGERLRDSMSLAF